MTRHVLVVGNGMAGARLAEELRRRVPDPLRLAVTVVGEEPHAAYNRILLPGVVAGALAAQETRLKPEGWWAAHHVEVRTAHRVTAVDPGRRTATVSPTASGGRPAVLAYDDLVLATGSTAAVPPVVGIEAGDPAVVAFRTLDDGDRLVRAAAAARHAVVVGGGLLGLEAARALLARGLRVAVVQRAEHPMERQVDADAGRLLARLVRDLGVDLRTGRRASALDAAPGSAGPGGHRHLLLDDGTALPCDLLVLAAGVRPRTDLAEALGCLVEHGVVVDDALATSVPHVHAVGECAQHRGTVHGLVQPAWEQAAVLADVLTGSDPRSRYTGTAPLTRLKAADLDVASMGQVTADATDDDHEVVTVADPARGRYAKLVVRDDRVVGALLLGGGDATGVVTQLFDTGDPVPSDRLGLLLGRAPAGAGAGATDAVTLAQMPGGAVVCRCNTVTKAAVVEAFRAGATTRADVAAATRATTGCGSCAAAVDGLCGWLRSSEPPTTTGTTSAPTPAPTPETTPARGAA